jgi:hypothetical protein
MALVHIASACRIPENTAFRFLTARSKKIIFEIYGQLLLSIGSTDQYGKELAYRLLVIFFQVTVLTSYPLPPLKDTKQTAVIINFRIGQLYYCILKPSNTKQADWHQVPGNFQCTTL